MAEMVYLKVEDCGEGMFSNERILKARDYEGNTLEGFFDKCNIVKGMLKTTFAKDYGNYISILTPQCFFNESQFILVDKKDLFYKKSL